MPARAFLRGDQKQVTEAFWSCRLEVQGRQIRPEEDVTFFNDEVN